MSALLGGLSFSVVRKLPTKAFSISIEKDLSKGKSLKLVNSKGPFWTLLKRLNLQGFLKILPFTESMVSKRTAADVAAVSIITYVVLSIPSV